MNPALGKPAKTRGSVALMGTSSQVMKAGPHPGVVSPVCLSDAACPHWVSKSEVAVGHG